jgi:hypothetical protein
MKGLVKSLFSFVLCSLIVVTMFACQEDDDDFYGTFVNLTDEEHHEGLLQANLKNFHLYGYKVIESGNTINSDDGKGYAAPENVASKPVLDSAKFDQHLYSRTDFRSSDISYSYSHKIEEFYSKFNSTVSASYKGVAFSGDVHASFGVTTQTSEDQVFIRHAQIITIEESNYIGTVDQLKTMLSSQFLIDAQTHYNQNTLGKFFEDYGTHLITKYYLGGRTEFNFTHKNTQSKTDQQIQVDVNATYLTSTGSASETQKKTSQKFLENTYFTFKSYGGNAITGSSPDVIAQQYPAWRDSIDQKMNLCQFGSFEDSFFPIWNLIDNQTIRSAYENYFNALVDIRTTHLYNMRFNKLYLKEILVYTGGSESSAKGKIPNDYTPVYLNPGRTSDSYLEANHNAGGDFIYIVYNYTDKKSEAIVDIRIASGKNTDYSSEGFKKVNVDLNRGAGGDYIYLHYRTATSDEVKNANTKYIKEIRGVYGGQDTLPSGWYWLTNMVDLNRGAGGSYIYLAVRKA